LSLPARDDRLAELINTTLHTKPEDGSTHWSVRSVAEQTGISKTSVHRYFKLFGLDRQRRFHLGQAASTLLTCQRDSTLDHPQAQGARDGFDARLRGELQQDVLRMRLDRLRCDAQLLRDALVRQAVAHQRHDVALAGRERLA